MKLRVSQALAKELPEDVLRTLGLEQDGFLYQKSQAADLSLLDVAALRGVRPAIAKASGVRGTKALLDQLDMWIRAVEAPVDGRARNLRELEPLLIRRLGRAPGHRLYAKMHEMEAYLPYYVNGIMYVPPSQWEPEHVEVTLLYEVFAERKTTTIKFWRQDAEDQTPDEAMARRGIFPETAELRTRYLDELDRLRLVLPCVGDQFLARGLGHADLDGNDRIRSRHGGWWWNPTIVLDRDGEPARVVIDIAEEDDEHNRLTREKVDPAFWRNIPAARSAESGPVEVPSHPYLPCFDLRRHLRLRVHVNDVEAYEYDKQMAERLVIADDVKGLIELMLAHQGEGFSDIVAGKSGGSVILCCGPPGTGKTLTAEVYAESTRRPLYSVHASQLGVKPDEIETELRKTLQRAKRWRAILLIDEADVYVQTRGENIERNAIVGAFLRVLEHHNGVLFLTTNRPDDIDDAIASRCMARIDYHIPDPTAQARIWRVLADAAGIPLDDAEIQRIVADNPGLNGRDVKNLLKLASLTTNRGQISITAETTRQVRRFKPTRTEESHEH